MLDTAPTAAPAINWIKRPKRFHHDFETYSKLDVTKVGSSRYAQHASTEALMLGYAFDSGPIKQWVPVEGQEMPAEVEDAVLDDRVRKFAWNKPFEWAIWTHVYGMRTPHSAWRDPMVLALSLSLPGALEKAGPIIGLGPEYLKKGGGKVLMNWFSKDRPATKTLPERRIHWHQKWQKWCEYKEYNYFDVKAERKVWLNLSPYDLPEHEWELWYLDQEINNEGLPINMDMVRNAIHVRDDLIEDRLEKMKKITGLSNPNSGSQLLPWLRAQGYVFNDLKAGHIRRAKEMLDDQITGGEAHPEEVKDLWSILEMRQEVSKTSTKKFDALERMTDSDGRLRNSHQFAGAGRTWRWAGRGFQVQNLKKAVKGLDGLDWEKLPSGFKKVVGGTQIAAAHRVATMDAETLDLLYSEPMEVLGGAVRTVVQAPEGYVFIDADLSAIENVGLGWVSNDRKILSVFETGRDPYIDFATYLYKRTYQDLYAEYEGGDKTKRTISKPGVLGCGYMLSAGHQYEDKQTGEIEATGLLGYAWNMGVKLTPEQSELSVKVWRETFKDAVQFWWDISDAAFDCLKSGKRTVCGPLQFDRKGPFLRMVLPSERALHYVRPKLEQWLAPWGKYKLSVTYEQLNDKHQWDRVSTHPGKLTENAVQAIARDLLAHGMMLAASRGIKIVMHVHDQIIGLCREDEAEEKLRILQECMGTRPSWAKTIPLKSAGHISKWFVKD